MQTGTIQKSLGDKAFNVCNIVLLTILTLVILYPLYFIVIASISEPYAVAKGQVYSLPKGFTLEAYKNVFSNKLIWSGYENTIINTVLATSYNLLLTIPAAYVLTKKDMPGRMVMTWYFFITMYFGGGMVPTYLLVKSLGLLNTRWALILGTGVSCWNLIVTRQFFASSVPNSIYEAAYIDGASEIRTFTNIALPLSKPILAIMALFYGVGHWNAYYSALLYVTKKQLWPLQLVLRSILISNETALTAIDTSADMEEMIYAANKAYMAYAMKYALIFVASAPLLAAYPFVQKHFVKGMLIGSIKG